MSKIKTDRKLVTEMLADIASRAALLADALHESENSHVSIVTGWLTEAATGLGQVAMAPGLLRDVQLAAEWRQRLEEVSNARPIDLVVG